MHPHFEGFELVELYAFRTALTILFLKALYNMIKFK
jgi:hypothetical protein